MRHRQQEVIWMKHNGGLKLVLKNTIRKQKLLTMGLAAAICGSVAFALIPPLVLEKIVNMLTGGYSAPLSLALLYFVMLAVSGLFDTCKEVMITVFGQKITRGLRHEMCAKLSRMRAEYFTVNEAGIIASRFVNDVDTVDELFTNGVISMISDACKVAAIIVVIFMKSTGLGILMILVTPLLFYLTRLFQRRMLKAQLENRIAIGKVTNHVPETIRNIRMIHSFFREKYMEKRYDTYIQDSYRAVEKSNLYDSIYSPIIIFSSSCIIAVMMVLAAMGGGFQSFFNMSVGTAVAIIAYVGKVFDPLESIGMEIQNIQSAVAGVKRINEFLGQAERKAGDEALKLGDMVSSGEPAIRLDNVSFSYDEDKKVLDNLSFRVDTGENATLIGRTGCGKSTVFKLLLGLYNPDGGRVTVYGRDAEDIPDREKRSIFGYVEQSFSPVPGTITQQISLFDDTIKLEQVEEAAALVGLHESILKLEKGYDTPFDMSIFSQGQLQLLSIARAVVGKPYVMLLDEITANLDSVTERRVMEALNRASENRTVLSISHRLYEQMGSRTIPMSENLSAAE
jgi:ABC-type multidrug transport system fused ATPase/permease subunit